MAFGGYAATGANTLASRRAAQRRPGYLLPGSQPYQPQPIPVGAYNPIRDIELQAGKRGLNNQIEDIGTAETRGNDSFVLGQQQAQQNRDRSLATLADSYRRLGVRQNEQANSAGVLRGGALMQAAAKRAANQALAAAPINQSYERGIAGLARARQQEAEDHVTQGSRAEREQGQFGIDTRTLEAREASENGYTDPAGIVARTSVQPGAGFVRVGQPLRRQRGRY